jgi:hypothetical protein
MSMTTPRVTVPEAIEALKHCVENEKAHWSLSEICDPCVDVPVKYLRAAVEALPAAPAPEGGAVSVAAWDVVQRVSKLTVAGGDPLQDPAFAQYPSIADLVAKAQAALATRSDDKPEGGVVWFGVTGAADETEALAVALFDARCPGIRMTDEDLHYYRAAAQRAMQAVTDELDTPALATREEAPAELSGNPGELEVPAEAGEDAELIARLEEMADFFDGATDPVIAESVCDEHARDIRSALLALRAQPPASPSTLAELHAAERLIDQQAAEIRRLKAREDAQPVGWLRAVDEEMVCAHLGVADAEDSFETAKKKLASLIQWNIAVATDPSVGGHPAPDALRSAVEALEKIAYGGTYFAVGAMRDVATAALAALQAERKGGA